MIGVTGLLFGGVLGSSLTFDPSFCAESLDEALDRRRLRRRIVGMLCELVAVVDAAADAVEEDVVDVEARDDTELSWMAYCEKSTKEDQIKNV